MNFEYNGNLEEKDRINKVAKEIIKFYPEIALEKAKFIASLEDRITTSYNYNMHFMRLYNILFVYKDDEIIFKKVLKDLYKVYNLHTSKSENEELIDDIMNEIIRYVNKDREDFPLISQFY